MHTDGRIIINAEKAALIRDGHTVVKTFAKVKEGQVWYKLTAEQEAFQGVNPTASPEEVYKMELNIHVPSLDELKVNKVDEITAYDSSEAVNGFLFAGMSVWIDKDTRVGLMNSIGIEKASGRENSTLWLNGMRLVVPCDMALSMLSALELYALDCYNVTAEHKYNVTQMETAEDIEAYDHTAGYPEKLIFNN